MRTTPPLPLLTTMAIALTLVLALVACADDSGGAGDQAGIATPSPTATVPTVPETGTDAPADAGDAVGTDVIGDWRLTEAMVDGVARELVEGVPVTLTIGRGDIGGSAGCNTYNAGLTTTGEQAQIEELSVTRQSCAPHIMEFEEVYLEALQSTTEVSAEGDELVLSGEGSTLRFARA